MSVRFPYAAASAAVLLALLSSSVLASDETVTCTTETALDIVGPGAPKPNEYIVKVYGWERFIVDMRSGSILKSNSQQSEPWRVLQRGPGNWDFIAVPETMTTTAGAVGRQLIVAATDSIRIRKFPEHPDYTFAIMNNGGSVIMGKCQLGK